MLDVVLEKREIDVSVGANLAPSFILVLEEHSMSCASEMALYKMCTLSEQYLKESLYFE